MVDMAQENGLKFSSIRMGGTLAYAVVVIFAGMYLKTNPTASFGITAAAWAIMLIITRFMNGEVKTHKCEKQAGILTVLKNKKILFVLFYACVFQIVLGCYGSFLGLVVTDMGYDNAVIGRLMCVSALGEIPVLLCIGYLSRKIRIEYLLLIAGAAMTVRIWLPLTGSIAGIFSGAVPAGSDLYDHVLQLCDVHEREFIQGAAWYGPVSVLYGSDGTCLYLQQYCRGMAGRENRPS